MTIVKKTITYKVPIIHTVKTGEEERTEEITVCDSCEKPSILYYELEGSVFNHKRTGKVSPTKEEFPFHEKHPIGLKPDCMNCQINPASYIEKDTHRMQSTIYCK